MFIGENKNTIYTYNIDAVSFLAVNLTARGKGQNKSIRINNYTSNKYDDVAFKLASSPSVYLELEYINYSQQPIFTESIIFSQSELVNFLNWFSSSKELFFTTPNFYYQTQTPNLYPNLGFSSDGMSTGIWKMTNVETRGLCFIPISVLFFIIEEIMTQIRNNFVSLSAQMCSNYLQAYLAMETMLTSAGNTPKVTTQTQPTQQNFVNGFNNPNTVTQQSYSTQDDTATFTKPFSEASKMFENTYKQGKPNTLIEEPKISGTIELKDDLSNLNEIDFSKAFKEMEDKTDIQF